ncbi:MAG: cupin domain-containing protein [Betaproteobacteria bacterium]|nr:cupin domain-containing protein [Betaproteobacteria bacterium]MBP6317758.1 cupin domain-containing protein [Rubrivivax sp.]MBK7459733.1 cupin domain-containing protein [Betaproteobacteria bacterium]MBK7515635.1 cupin domain-containing protein [Betaproteobacteria bacterium]MBK8865289.1 cupin domain-containing protein [Betaproteobacteria bacterium]
MSPSTRLQGVRATTRCSARTRTGSRSRWWRRASPDRVIPARRLGVVTKRRPAGRASRRRPPRACRIGSSSDAFSVSPAGRVLPLVTRCAECLPCGAGIRPAPRPGPTRRTSFFGVIVPKPFVNLADVEFNDVEDNGFFTSRRALFSAGIGARKLGYNLTVVPPGKAQCPFHSHRGEEEMFLILEGEGELRYGDQRYAIRKHDVIACPTGGAEVAHQLINTGGVDLRYLALSNLVEIEACEYPDSSKIAVRAHEPGTPRLWKMFRAETHVEYYEREDTEGPEGEA